MDSAMCFLSLSALLASWIGFSTAMQGTSIPNNCPEILKYRMSPQNEVYGVMTVPYNQESSLEVVLEFSLGMAMPKTDKVIFEPLDRPRKGKYSMSYKIGYSNPGVVPVVTKFSVNRKVYCQGPGAKGAKQVTEGEQRLRMTLD